MGRWGSIVGGVAMLACGVPAEGEPSTASIGHAESTSTASGPESTAAEDAPETSADPSSSSTDPSDTEVMPPQCGNGELEAGEVCDDNNTIDADGCNSDCRLTGIVLFEQVFDPAPLANEDLRDIAVAEDGTYVIGGFVAGAGRDAWAARVTEDDGLMWEVTLVAGTYDDAIFGVAARQGGNTVVAGVVDEVGGTGDPWLAALAPTGTILAVEQYASPFYGRWLEVADVGDGIVVVGQHDDGAGAHGIVRNYGYDLVSQAEVEPFTPAVGLMLNDVCTSGDQVLVSGQRYDVSSFLEGLSALLDGPATQWVGVANAEVGQHAYATACAVSGDGDGRLFWSAGYDTAVAPKWLAELRARDIAGAIAIEAPTYVGETDVGAFYTDVATDTRGNVIVVGGTVTGAGEFDWAPVVRKYDPGGGLLWTRTFMPGGFPLGAIQTVATTLVGEIRLGGYASDAMGLRRRWLVRMTP